MSKRLLKELQSLAPWQWDSNIHRSPAGPASLRDFEGVQSLFNAKSPAKRNSRLSKATAGRQGILDDHDDSPKTQKARGRQLNAKVSQQLWVEDKSHNNQPSKKLKAGHDDTPAPKAQNSSGARSLPPLKTPQLPPTRPSNPALLAETPNMPPPKPIFKPTPPSTTIKPSISPAVPAAISPQIVTLTPMIAPIPEPASLKSLCPPPSSKTSPPSTKPCLPLLSTPSITNLPTRRDSSDTVATYSSPPDQSMECDTQTADLDQFQQPAARTLSSHISPEQAVSSTKDDTKASKGYILSSSGLQHNSCPTDQPDPASAQVSVPPKKRAKMLAAGVGALSGSPDSQTTTFPAASRLEFSKSPSNSPLVNALGSPQPFGSPTNLPGKTTNDKQLNTGEPSLDPVTAEAPNKPAGDKQGPPHGTVASVQDVLDALAAMAVGKMEPRNLGSVRGETTEAITDDDAMDGLEVEEAGGAPELGHQASEIARPALKVALASGHDADEAAKSAVAGKAADQVGSPDRDVDQMIREQHGSQADEERHVVEEETGGHTAATERSDAPRAALCGTAVITAPGRQHVNASNNIGGTVAAANYPHQSSLADARPAPQRTGASGGVLLPLIIVPSAVTNAGPAAKAAAHAPYTTSASLAALAAAVKPSAAASAHPPKDHAAQDRRKGLALGPGVHKVGKENIPPEGMAPGWQQRPVHKVTLSAPHPPSRLNPAATAAAFLPSLPQKQVKPSKATTTTTTTTHTSRARRSPNTKLTASASRKRISAVPPASMQPVPAGGLPRLEIAPLRIPREPSLTSQWQAASTNPLHLLSRLLLSPVATAAAWCQLQACLKDIDSAQGSQHRLQRLDRLSP